MTEDLKDFWKHIFKYYYGGGSGVNPSVDGWIINFIPYIDNKRSKFAQRSINETIKQYKEGDKKMPEDIDSEDVWLDMDLS